MDLRRILTRDNATTLGTGALLAIFLARITEGSIWFSGFVTKTPWNGFGWFPDWVRKEAEYAEIAPYKWFLENIVIPNITFFGWVQFLTEMFLFVTITFGILIGLNGLVMTLWALNISIGSYPVPSDEPAYVHQIFVLLPLIVWTTRSGRILGVDAFLRPKFEASANPMLRWLAKWAM